MATIDPLMKRFFVLHARMQVFFRIWDQRDAARYDAGFTNVVAVEELRRLQAALGGPALSDAALRATLQANLDLLERFAQSLQVLASEVDPALGRFVAPVGADEAPFDIRAITLTRPDRRTGVPPCRRLRAGQVRLAGLACVRLKRTLRIRKSTLGLNPQIART